MRGDVGVVEGGGGPGGTLEDSVEIADDLASEGGVKVGE